jgi:hypothetical protein
MEIQFLRQRDLGHETEMEQIRNQIDKMESLVNRIGMIQTESGSKYRQTCW